MQMRRKKVILDLDTGIDDSIALAFAARHPRIELLGVTGTYGNVETAVGVRNTLDVLALTGCSDVPVFAGESHALANTVFHRHAASVRIHGENGTGQVVLPRSSRAVETESAIDFLIRSMREHQSDLTIITTGPLTNLATVLLREPELRNWRGQIVSMGGAVTVRGNVSRFAEANISQDPEAAQLVLESGLMVTLVPLDVTMRSRLTAADAARWRTEGSLAGRLLGDMLDYYLANTLGTDETYIHDPSAVVCALHPEFFTMFPCFMTVETDGADRGRTIVDHRRLRDKSPQTRFCLDVDTSKVEHAIA